MNFKVITLSIGHEKIVDALLRHGANVNGEIPAFRGNLEGYE